MIVSADNDWITGQQDLLVCPQALYPGSGEELLDVFCGCIILIPSGFYRLAIPSKLSSSCRK
jgi:hypothetical protein